MKAVKCPYCSGPTKRNGRTSSGAQRWRCTACGAIDHRALRRHRRPLRRVPVVASVEGHAARDARRWPDLQAQDRGVLGGLAHAGARRRVPPGPLRRRDLARGTPGRADLLQRGSGGLVVHGAIRERSRAWSALMEPIPAPDVVVTDGGSGFAKAVRAAWPRTKGCRDACSTRTPRSRGARRRGRSSRRDGSCTRSPSTSRAS